MTIGPKAKMQRNRQRPSPEYVTPGWRRPGLGLEERLGVRPHAVTDGVIDIDKDRG